MEIETVEDLVNQIADWLGIYGCCKHGECSDVCLVDNESACLHGEGCEEKAINCCRSRFTTEMIDRVENAVKNTEKLESLQIIK